MGIGLEACVNKRQRRNFLNVDVYNVIGKKGRVKVELIRAVDELRG